MTSSKIASPEWALAIALVLALLVYWAGLPGPLVLDDKYNLGPITDWLHGERSGISVVFGNTSGALGRPVSMASFLLNVMLFGPGIWGLKLTNVIIHLVNGVLVYGLFRGLASRGALCQRKPTSDWVALLGASVWMLHPFLVSTVLYVVQRMAMLSAMFSLITMLAYLHGRVALERTQTRRAVAWLLLAPLAMVLGTFSKENGILAASFCGVIELFAFAPRAGHHRPKFSIAFVVATLVLPAFLAIVLTVTHNTLIVADYATRPFTLSDRLLTEPRVLWDYISGLILPYGPKLGLYHDDYVVSHGLLDPPTTLMAIAGWFAVIGAAWGLRSSIPGFALGLGIFLVGHALESSVFPLMVYFEHRNYLPFVGAILALLSLALSGAQLLSSRMHHAGSVFPIAGVSLVLVLALATAARAGVWRTHDALLAQGLTYHPESRWLRLDASAWALLQTPPQVGVARAHVDHLRNSSDPESRRMGAAARLIIDCAAGAGAQPEYVSGAFEGSLSTLETDLLLTFEGLSDNIAAKPCAGLSPAQMARQLALMLDHASVPQSDMNMRRLRFKAALLFIQAHEQQLAMDQARLAYSGRVEDVAIAIFIAELQLEQGNYVAASRMIDIATEQVAPGDYNGHQLIDRMRAMIRDKRNRALTIH